MKALRLPKLMKASNGRSCVRCNAQDGTVVRAHYVGFRQHIYGKGMGRKPSDLCAADLCGECHDIVDGRQTKDTTLQEWDCMDEVSRSEAFLHYVILTLHRDFAEGVIK